MYNAVKQHCFQQPDTISAANVTPINELYVPQTNGEISVSIMQNWTLQATECYEINSDCTRCSLYGGNYSFICQMPKIVKALLKAYGPPQNSQSANEL